MAAGFSVLSAHAQTADTPEDGLDWPAKAVIAPRDPGQTPAPGQDLAISYDCGEAGPCGLSDFMERMHACALFVIRAGEPILHRTSVRSDSDDCKPAVEQERYGVASITKSIVSLLFGILYTDPAYGAPVDLDSPAADLLAEAGVDYPNREVTLRHLLQMSSSMSWSEDEADATLKISVKPDGTPAGPHRTLKEAVNARLRRASFHPRRQFLYSGFDTQLIGILAEHRLAASDGVKRGTLDEALERLLWKELPTHRPAEWNADFDAHPAAHCCAYTAAGDLAALGAWMLEQYKAGTGPAADWVRASVTDTVDPSWTCDFRGTQVTFRYGYQWWTTADAENGFTGIGTRGQYLHVFPEQDVVVVQLGEQNATDADTCEAMLVHRLIADEVK